MSFNNIDFFTPSDRPNKQVKGDYERTLFVGRLSSDTREGTTDEIL